MNKRADLAKKPRDEFSIFLLKEGSNERNSEGKQKEFGRKE